MHKKTEIPYDKVPGYQDVIALVQIQLRKDKTDKGEFLAQDYTQI